MKKIKTIYTITGINIKSGWESRCFGFFHKLKKAIKELENTYDFYELGSHNQFEYIVIESVDEGLYSLNREEYWFQIKNDLLYHQIEKPKFFDKFCCYGVG